MAGGNLINGRSAERQLLYFLAPENFGSGMRRGGQQEIGRQDGIRPSRLSSDSTRSSLQEEDKDAVGHTYILFHAPGRKSSQKNAIFSISQDTDDNGDLEQPPAPSHNVSSRSHTTQEMLIDYAMGCM